MLSRQQSQHCEIFLEDAVGTTRTTQPLERRSAHRAGVDRRRHAAIVEHVEFAGRETPCCPANQEGVLFSGRVELRHTLTIGRECEECMTKRSAVGQGSEPIECLTEIVENVLGRLDPDAEPDQIGWHLEFGPGGGRVGHHAGMLDQGLDRTERFGE